jgi:hypothetical protein
MVAPFWGDVDTRGGLSGLVYYKLTPTHLIVQWEQVGYFASHDDLLNTFQLIITDGNDTIIPTGKNVNFCYQDMQWTTGDASGGSGGFGGTPTTVGINQGNGVDFIQLGLYDHAGVDWDGALETMMASVHWMVSHSFSIVVSATRMSRRLSNPRRYAIL